MILTVLGYLVVVLLAWVGCYVLIFTASLAWHDGKAQAGKRITEEIRRWDDSLHSTEILRRLNEIDHKEQVILDLTDTYFSVTQRMNKTMGELLQMEADVLRELGGGNPPVPPTLVS